MCQLKRSYLDGKTGEGLGVGVEDKTQVIEGKGLKKGVWKGKIEEFELFQKNQRSAM
jgi:hypothetical protein